MLALKAGTISVAFGSVSFFMVEDDRTIRVDVSQTLLAQIDGPPPKTKGEYAGRPARHREVFAQIAADKYADGQYQPEVNVLVVRIDADDILAD